MTEEDVDRVGLAEYDEELDHLTELRDRLVNTAGYILMDISKTTFDSKLTDLIQLGDKLTIVSNFIIKNLT